jgi:digeranylgeranylglycerophospholipid reductase
MNICIVGAGPAGNYTAYLLAKSGHRVQVYEKQPKIGSPVQCTGILSDHFKSILTPKEDFVLNIINKTRIYSPNNNYIETKLKTNYIICRKKFDNYLANLAKKQGVKFYLNHSFKSYKQIKNQLEISVNNKGILKKIKSDILIGADGPISAVSKSANLFNNRKFVIGTQIEAKLKNDNVVEFYPYLGCYAWIVPVDKNTVRIGISGYKDTKKIFQKFAIDKLGINYDKKTIENQSGIIPVFNPFVQTQKNNIYLVGDAATFVKTTSGGGINQSLKAAKILTDSINNNKNYNIEWKKRLFANLFTHLTAHNIMTKFKENDWNDLIDYFNEPKLKKILYSESRDNIVKMMFKIITSKPSLIKYARYLF